jgi:hypothetical protein
MQPYTPEIEAMLREFYTSLNERDRRRYAGIEALKLEHGGQNYIARVLGCSRRTVRRGAREVSGLSTRAVQKQLAAPSVPKPRIREAGGGRKPYGVTHPDLDTQFLEVLREHTAGDPMDATVRWTNLREWEIVAALEHDYSVRVSRRVVRQLLKKHYYRRRKAQKRQALKADIPDRNAQFEYLAQLTATYRAAGNPIISMDTKKKEHLGNFYREGHLYTLSELQVYDHDFPSFAEGVIIPHSLYDVQLNLGYIQVGTSHDTSEFACDSFRHWWYTYGQRLYPHSTSILVLCDGGGSNSAAHYIFKHDLQTLADEIGVEIRIAHYPPYCSKYNPIEHRLFPHVTRACQGVIFTSMAVVTELLRKTRTQTGLRVFVHVLDKAYATGRKVADTFKSEMRIVFDELLPKLNYRAIPMAHTNG